MQDVRYCIHQIHMHLDSCTVVGTAPYNLVEIFYEGPNSRRPCRCHRGHPESSELELAEIFLRFEWELLLIAVVL